MDVVGVGDADIDIYLQVDHIPGRDEKILARNTHHYHPGGMIANFLVALRRLGTACAFHGPVGDDEFGAMSLAALSANGVDTSGAVIKAGEKTYFCVVMLDSSGEKSLIVAPTTCLFPALDDLSEQVIARARHLHTAASDVETALRATTIAKENGLTTSIDIEAGMVEPHASTALLAQVDLLFVNQEAARRLSNTTELEDAARHLLQQGPQIVCITMGAEGSLVVDAASTYRAKAFTVPVVDSTGAGDCFAAGFVHGYLQGWSLPRTATFASAVAALNVMHLGGHGGAPLFNHVAAFLSTQGVHLPTDDYVRSDMTQET